MINRPKTRVYKVIRPRIIFLSCEGLIFLTSIFHFYFLHFSSTRSFLGFSFFNLSCFYLHIPTSYRVISKLFFSIFHTYFSTYTFYFCHWNKIRSFIPLETIFLLHMPLSVEGDPWSGFKKKTIKLKWGSKWIIFYTNERIVKNDRLSSQTQSPNWRAVP